MAYSMNPLNIEIVHRIISKPVMCFQVVRISRLMTPFAMQRLCNKSVVQSPLYSHACTVLKQVGLALAGTPIALLFCILGFLFWLLITLIVVQSPLFLVTCIVFENVLASLLGVSVLGGSLCADSSHFPLLLLR